jgi:hypothetical protein
MARDLASRISLRSIPSNSSLPLVDRYVAINLALGLVIVLFEALVSH